MYLFVYGTLKRGHSRNRFLAGQTFVDVVRTRPLYRLYNLGDYPGLVASPEGLAIEGELWDITASCLTELDQVEDCDTGLYRRAPIELAPPYDTAPTITYFYAQSVSGRPDCGSCW